MKELTKGKIIKKLLLYIAGIQILALGMMLMVRCDLGVSVGTASYYVFSQRFTFFSLGVWSYLAHGLVLILMMVILRKIRLFYLMSFVTSVLLGYSMDFYGLLLPEKFENMVLRLIFMCVGIVGVALGIALNYASGLPAAPYDTFSKEISRHFNWKISKVKTTFDLTCLSISIVFGFIFFGKIIGIGIGTVVSAFLTGTIIGLFKKLLEQHGLTAEAEG